MQLSRITTIASLHEIASRVTVDLTDTVVIVVFGTIHELDEQKHWNISDVCQVLGHTH